MKKRQPWFDGRLDLSPERLIFIDETWASANKARRYGRGPRGERLRVGVPHGHRKTTTLVAGLRLDAIAASFVLDGPINRIAFEAHVEKVLVPELRPKDGVIMGNVSSQKGSRVREIIEALVANLRALPPYSSDINSIDNAFTKHLRKAAELYAKPPMERRCHPTQH